MGYLIILIPLLAGLICLIFRKKLYFISLFFSFCCFVLNLLLLVNRKEYMIDWLKFLKIDIVLISDFTSLISSVLASFFGLIVVIFSKKILDTVKENIYFSFIFFILAFTHLSLLSKNLILFLISWEILGIIVYLLIRFVTANDEFNTATKAITIISISDFSLLIGIILLIKEASNMYGLYFTSYNLDVNKYPLIFSLLTIGALGKIGAIPFHTWIPETAEKIPSALGGFLIGALDKILGIYLLVRITKDIFILNYHPFLMILGSLTVLIAVFMALIQHNLKKLLSYHAISQIGYMVVGISTGSVLGIVGGVFHMINNTIYKTLLFLSSDFVEKYTEDVELTKAKGLAKYYPLCFVFTLIAVLSISGIPPFNGFFSKWLIYQSVIEVSKKYFFVGVLVLISIMFGSALTFASFVKVLYSVFLSKSENEDTNRVLKEKEKIFNVLPMGILAILCIILGIFSFEIPISRIVKPMLGFEKILLIGEWNAQAATYLLILGVFIGLIIYILFVDKPRKVNVYLLGEEEKLGESYFPSTDFYLTIKQMFPFSVLYYLAENKLFDIYNWFLWSLSFLVNGISKVLKLDIVDLYIFSKKNIFKVAEKLSFLHNGNLHSYLSWIFISILILFFIFLL